MPAIQQWPFTEDDAHHVQQPVLAALETASFFARHSMPQRP
jgi:hypothetical protein